MYQCLKKLVNVKNTVVLSILTFRHIQCLHIMYVEVVWVLVSSRTQVQLQILLDPHYIPDYLSVSYGYDFSKAAKLWLSNLLKESHQHQRFLKIYCLCFFGQLRRIAPVEKQLWKSTLGSFHINWKGCDTSHFNLRIIDYIALDYLRLKFHYHLP